MRNHEDLAPDQNHKVEDGCLATASIARLGRPAVRPAWSSTLVAYTQAGPDTTRVVPGGPATHTEVCRALLQSATAIAAADWARTRAWRMGRVRIPYEAEAKRATKAHKDGVGEGGGRKQKSL